MKQEIERFGFGDFNMGAILNEGMSHTFEAGPSGDSPFPVRP